MLKDKNARANKGVAFVQFNLKSQANNGEFSVLMPIFNAYAMSNSTEPEWLPARWQQQGSGG